jgi:hypothetical protein
VRIPLVHGILGDSKVNVKKVAPVTITPQNHVSCKYTGIPNKKSDINI